jgi:hypothetical protein
MSFVKFHVYNSETRKPVSGAEVTLFSVGTAYTDETGTCEMWSPYVVPFQATLMVSKDGYETIYEYGYTVNYENTLYLVPVSAPPPAPEPTPTPAPAPPRAPLLTLLGLGLVLLAVVRLRRPRRRLLAV